MSRRNASKPLVGTDDEYQPSPALSKSANTIASSSSSSRAHRRTAAVVPVIETQHASTSGQTSRLTGPGRSGLSSSTLPAARGGARGAAGSSRGSSSATPVAKPPSSLRNIVKSSNIISLPLTEDTRLLSFWFLRTVFLQGIFACAEYQSKSEDLEISPANWVSFFDKHSPRMVAYKAKYGKYMATTWSAAFLLGVQRFCAQMLGQYARKDLKRYQTEWFIEESILTYPFIGGDEFPGLSSPILMPSELISGGFVNYNKFSIDFELSISGLDQGELFPEEAIFISNLVEGVGLSQVGIHSFSLSPRLFDPSEDALVDNMFIDFEAVESENEHQTDNGQEEEDDDGQEEEEEDGQEEEEEDDDQEPEEEDADHDVDVEEDPSPIDNEVEFVGEAVEQPVRIRSSRLAYPTSPVPKPVSSSAYTSKSKKGQSSHDKDSGFPRLEGGRPNTSLFGYDSVLARGGGKSRTARTSNAAGTPCPETKGVRMITERFAAPGDFNDNERVRLHATLDSLVHSTIPLQPFPSVSCTNCIRIGVQCSMPPESTSSARHECHRCLMSKTPCSFSYPVERADEERRRLFMHAARSNGAVAMFSSTLAEENLGLLRTEVLLRSFLTEFTIQASNVARRQAQLRNSASDPRSLLKALIEDGFVAETDTERLSMLAFLLGWDKRFTLEDLEFEGLSQIPLPEVIAPPPTQSQVGHLHALIPSDMVPPIPGLIRRPQYKGKGKAKAVEAASEEGSAPEEASTVVAEPVSSSGSSEESEEEAVVHAHSPSKRRSPSQSPSAEEDDKPVAKR
ncbi:hypothetical protein BT96DRAFT_1002056 [Gymnopus androsaceus JB14]|uniref:Uncharacterized protein n=1 Tax=Gymnopus androsaceus JB14 TaxID=1447944 RepID=A0A6A4GYZ5_9AGAR|nr:hypothetical protein BT96DRAFT_1002056 [Gymnopus androsaceus JB14]